MGFVVSQFMVIVASASLSGLCFLQVDSNVVTCRIRSTQSIFRVRSLHKMTSCDTSHSVKIDKSGHNIVSALQRM